MGTEKDSKEKKDNGIKSLLRSVRRSHEEGLDTENFVGLGDSVKDSVTSLSDRLYGDKSVHVEEDVEKLKQEELDRYESAEQEEKVKVGFEKDMLGLPVVTIKKVLELEHAVKDDEIGTIRTAIVDHKGDDVVVGIWPGIDVSKIIEGDTAIYDNKEEEGTNMIIRLLDCITPGKIPDVEFADVGGLDDQIKEVKVLLDIFNPRARERAQKLNRKLRNGCLLYGPPGTGKTMMAEAAANYAKVPFFFVNTPELFDSHLGGSVNRLKGWAIAAQKYAKKTGGAILYFDEITRLGAKRNYDVGGADSEVSAVTEELQALMNGDHQLNPEEGIVLYMASTNLEKKLDPAVLRRFKAHIRIPPPHIKGKEEILEVKLRNVKCEKLETSKIISQLTDIKPGATGADIDMIVEKAKEYAEMNDRDYLYSKDFDNSLEYFSQRVDVLLSKGMKEYGSS
ncbi:MAG: AAA family ATPase [Nanoarchaeota archaeon]|nr:AAA family ATPase [Nanoarchaeota archaeon]